MKVPTKSYIEIYHVEITPFSPPNFSKTPKDILVIGVGILSLIIAAYHYESP